MKRILIKADNIAIRHKSGVLYNGVCFEIREGDCIMLCGANGSGKTTLLKMLEAHCHGQISENVPGLTVSQDCESAMLPARIPKVPGFTLKEFVRIGCYRQSDFSGSLSTRSESAIDRALDKLDIGHLAWRDISTLSDGEFQKACIAIALVRNASVIFLDEPTAFLDAENRISVLQILRKLCTGKPDNERGSLPAIVFSTHDLHDGMEAATKIFALGADSVFRCSEKDAAETVKSIFSNPESFK